MHCGNTVITKILLVPLINTKTIVRYRNMNGKLVNTNGRVDHYSIISNDAVFSKATNLLNQRLQVIGRSCEISNDVNSTVQSTVSMLLEHFTFYFSRNLTMKESCPTETGVITTDWIFYRTTSILLPVTCSLSSTKINCRALRMTSQKTKQVKINPA